VADPVYGARLQYLDWNGLVQSRVSSLITRLEVWVALAAVLLIGPMAVFVAPRIFTSLDRIRERVTFDRRRKPDHLQRREVFKRDSD
jgi:hypothetical protein